MTPAWYNQPLVDGMKDSRFSVAPSAEHESMEEGDLIFPVNTAVPALSREMVLAGQCCV